MDAQILDAIGHYRNLDDEGATALLNAVLAGKISSEQAAQAHMYLGLIAFNALRAEDAREQFKLALAASPYAEIPTDASPKAKLLLAQIRAELLQESQSAAETTERPPAEATAVQPAPTETRAGRWYAWVTAAAAAAALGVGVGFGVAQAGAQAGLKTVMDASQATSLGQAVARDGLIADVLFGVGGAAGIAAVVLFAVPPHDAGDASASLSIAAGPGTVQVTW